MNNLYLKSISSDQCYLLQDGVNRIGKKKTSRIILKDDIVSRIHASIIIRPDRVSIIDHSRNGLWINGQRVVHKCLLHLGDVIRFPGGSSFRLVDNIPVFVIHDDPHYYVNEEPFIISDDED